MTFASPLPSGYSNECVAFDGHLTDNENGTNFGNYHWGKTARYTHGLMPDDEPRSAMWVAAGGNRGFRPLVSATSNTYANAPKGIKSRLVCGPYDLTKSTEIALRFKYINLGRYTSTTDDEFFVGISNDGQTFHSSELFYAPNWSTRTWIPLQDAFVGHDTIYFMFEFSTKTSKSKGAWLSDLSIIGDFDPPECGDLSTGYKGINLPAGDPNFGGANFVPFIRPGAEQALSNVGPQGVDADFVRLEFIAKHGNSNASQNGVLLDEYDYIVDHLCSKGVGVVGILTHKTIRDKYDNYAMDGPDVSNATRNDFVNEAARLAEHYAGRITYWEIWNEPDFDPNLPNGVPDAPRLSEDNFADILVRGAQAIKINNPSAKIVFGGLSSPWSAVSNYYFNVLDILKREYGQTTPPFDYFANHPYSSGRIGHPNCDPDFPCYGISPDEYLLQSPAHGHDPNFLFKFQDTFDNIYNGEPQPPIWITEIGWNAATDSLDNRNCEEQLLVDEDEQAEYLWNSFDIFSDIPQFNSSQPAIEKVFWYQYLDIMVPLPERCKGNRATDTTPNAAAVIRWRADTAWHDENGQPSRSICSPQDQDMAWFFGLFEPNCSVTHNNVEPVESQLPRELTRLSLHAEPNKIVINEQSGDMYIQLNRRFIGRFHNNKFVEYLYPTIPPNSEEWMKGDSAKDIAVHESKNRLYIMSGKFGQVTVYHNNKLENTIKLDGGYAERIAVNQQTGEAFVVSQRGDGFQKQLVSILKDGQLVSSFDLDDGFNFRDMVVDPVYGYVYLIGGGLEGGFVSVIKNGNELERHLFPEHLINITIDEQTGNVYTTHRYLEEAADGGVRLSYFHQGVLQDSMTHTDVGQDITYESLAFSPFDQAIFIYGQGSDHGVHVFKHDEANDLVYTGKFEIASGPFNYSTADPTNGHYYMVHTTLGRVGVANDLKLLGEIEVGFQPSFVAVHEQTHEAYVSNEVEGTLSILGISSESYLPIITASE